MTVEWICFQFRCRGLLTVMISGSPEQLRCHNFGHLTQPIQVVAGPSLLKHRGQTYCRDKFQSCHLTSHHTLYHLDRQNHLLLEAYLFFLSCLCLFCSLFSYPLHLLRTLGYFPSSCNLCCLSIANASSPETDFYGSVLPFDWF